MAGEQRLSILVADDDPDVIADYRSILCPPKTRRAPDFDNPSRIEDEVFGAALDHDAFPEIDLFVVGRCEEAAEAVRRAVAETRSFAAAFIGVELRGDDHGLDAVEDIRALDPDMPIVLVAARCGMHPVDVCARIPPADRVSILTKPFHAVEIQQFVLNLAARRSAEHAARAAAARRRELSRAVADLPVGFAQYDEGGQLVYANRWMRAALPDAGEPGPFGPLSPRRDGEPWPHLPRTRFSIQDMALTDTGCGTAPRIGASMVSLDDGRRFLELESKVPAGGLCRLYVDVTSLAGPDLPTDRHGRHAQDVPKIPLRPPDSDRPSLDCGVDTVEPEASAAVATHRVVNDGTLQGCVVAAVERVCANSNGNGAATLEVLAPTGGWPARVDGVAIETALERLLRSVAQATPPGGHIRVELVNARPGRRQGRRNAGLGAGDHICISIHFAVNTTPASASAVGRVPPATSFAQLGAGLDEVQGIAARAGGYVQLELANGSRVVVAIHLPRQSDDVIDQPSNGKGSRIPVGPRRSRGREGPIGTEPAD